MAILLNSALSLALALNAKSVERNIFCHDAGDVLSKLTMPLYRKPGDQNEAGT